MDVNQYKLVRGKENICMHNLPFEKKHSSSNAGTSDAERTLPQIWNYYQ